MPVVEEQVVLSTPKEFSEHLLTSTSYSCRTIADINRVRDQLQKIHINGRTSICHFPIDGELLQTTLNMLFIEEVDTIVYGFISIDKKPASFWTDSNTAFKGVQYHANNGWTWQLPINKRIVIVLDLTSLLDVLEIKHVYLVYIHKMFEGMSSKVVALSLRTFHETCESMVRDKGFAAVGVTATAGSMGNIVRYKSTSTLPISHATMVAEFVYGEFIRRCPLIKTLFEQQVAGLPDDLRMGGLPILSTFSTKSLYIKAHLDKNDYGHCMIFFHREPDCQGGQFVLCEALITLVASDSSALFLNSREVVHGTLPFSKGNQWGCAFVNRKSIITRCVNQIRDADLPNPAEPSDIVMPSWGRKKLRVSGR